MEIMTNYEQAKFDMEKALSSFQKLNKDEQEQLFIEMIGIESFKRLLVLKKQYFTKNTYDYKI